ncbi:MAG: NAD(P)-dependent oxidoreductase [Bacteroidota bacterium]
MVAFIGMGLLGSGFVKAMLKRGEKVNVWNRTVAKAKVLEADGAKAFENIADAVKGVERIHITVSDDQAVDQVLTDASAGFAPGVLIIDHTTTTAKGAAERTEKWQQRGFTYLHAPVFMGPANALDASGYMLVSGDQELIKRAEPVLSAMTGKLLNFGTEVNRAAGIKLLGNSFLMFLTAGLSDTLALAQAMDIPAADLVTLFDTWNPGAMVPGRLKRILAADFDNPSWELNMARKDVRLMVEEAGNGDKELAYLPAIAVEMDKWIAAGNGNKDWTVIAKDNL